MYIQPEGALSDSEDEGEGGRRNHDDQQRKRRKFSIMDSMRASPSPSGEGSGLKPISESGGAFNSLPEIQESSTNMLPQTSINVMDNIPGVFSSPAGNSITNPADPSNPTISGALKEAEQLTNPNNDMEWKSEQQNGR